MKTSIIKSIFLLFLATSSLLSQWTQTSSLNAYGGIIKQILQNENYLYALIPSAGLYVSSNQGAQWANTTTGLTNIQVYCVTANQQRVFIGTSNGVYQSINQGFTWNQMPDSGLLTLGIFSLAMKNNVIYAGANDQVYISNNFGNSWTHGNSIIPGVIAPIVIDSVGSNSFYIYAGTPYGLIWSIDEGLNWNYTILANQIYGIAAYGPYIYASIGYGIKLSNDFGNSFSLVGPQQSFIHSLSSEGAIVYASASDGIYKSTNNGSVWNNILPNIEMLSAYANGNNLFAGTDGYGVRISSDGGQNWMNASNGLTPIQISALCSIGNEIFAGTYGDGVFESTNDGLSWVPLNDNISVNYIRKMTCTDSTLFALESSKILYTSNPGINWFAINDGGSNLAVKNNYVYLGINVSDDPGPFSIKKQGGDKIHGINLTTDYGASWSWVYPSDYVSTMAADSSSIIASVYGSVQISFNHGINWINVSSGLPTASGVNRFYFYDNNILAGFLGSGIYLSSNYGTSWNPINSGLTSQNINCFTSFNNSLYVGTDSGVFESTNLGASWVDKSSNLLSNKKIRSLSENGNYLVALADDNMIWKFPLPNIIGNKHTGTNIPHKYSLYQNYPNPFNPSTKINYDLPENTYVKLIVYDALGREVKALVNEKQNAGSYRVEFEGSNLPSGIYFYNLITGSYSATRKLVLLK